MLFAAVTWKRVPTAAASGALRGRQFFYAQFFTGVTSAQPCAHVERRRGRRVLGERLSFSPFVDGVVSQEHVAKKSQRHDICRPAAGGDARGSPTLSHRTFTPAFVASIHLKRSRFRPPGFAHSPHRWFSIGLPLAGELERGVGLTVPAVVRRAGELRAGQSGGSHGWRLGDRRGETRGQVESSRSVCRQRRACGAGLSRRGGRGAPEGRQCSGGRWEHRWQCGER